MRGVLNFFASVQAAARTWYWALGHKLRVQKQLLRVCLDAVVSKSGSEKQNFKKLVEVEKGVAVAVEDLFKFAEGGISTRFCLPA